VASSAPRMPPTLGAWDGEPAAHRRRAAPQTRQAATAGYHARAIEQTDPKPADGQVAALVVAADMHPECRSGHPPSANPHQSMTISGSLSRWKPKATDPKLPDGEAAALDVDVGSPPKWTLRVAPSLARWPDEGGEGSVGRTSHKYLESRHLERGVMSGELPFTSSLLSIPFLSLLIPHSLMSSTSTGSISSDCDHYGHSHMM
jgi:hypothetical protein